MKSFERSSNMTAPPSPAAPAPQRQQEFRPEELEQLAESIVSEKFIGVEKRLSDVEFLKSGVAQDITQVKAEIVNLKSKYVKLQEESISKIEEYNKKLDAVMGNFRALENVLSLLLEHVEMLLKPRKGKKNERSGGTAKG